MLNLGELNWIAIAVVTAAGFALGGLWYGPLFQKQWLVAVNRPIPPEGLGPRPYVVSIATALITATLIAALVHALKLTTAGEGLLLGAVIGVGFIATAIASDYAFAGESWARWAIEAGYRAVYAVISALVLVLWP